MSTRTLTPMNGRLPAEQLVDIGAGHVLRADAAASYERMRAAACPPGITDAYRPLERQHELWDLQGHLGTAARPGTSWHGEGLALDLPEPARTWVASHGRAFGWQRTISYEPWHFEYFATHDTRRPREDEPMTDEDRAWLDARFKALDERVRDKNNALDRRLTDVHVPAIIAGVLDAVAVRVWGYKTPGDTSDASAHLRNLAGRVIAALKPGSSS